MVPLEEWSLMSLFPLAIRSIGLVAMAVWVGGFTFYGGVVVPILNDELDHLQAGGITQRVTDVLNAIGVVTVVLWSIIAWVDRATIPAWVRRVRLGLLAMSTISLVALIVLHQVMDHRLDGGHFSEFYPLHRLYLATSTGQWLVNLGWIAASLALWQAGRSPGSGDDRASGGQ